MEADPIGLEGGLNIYGYANQNPMSYVDPLGLSGTDIQISPPSFLSLTTVAALKRNTLDQAVASGALTRTITMPALMIPGLPYAVGVAGPAGVRAGAMCYRAVERNKDICSNAILAAALGAGICKGDPADDFVNDMKNREEIRHGSELAGQKRIGTQRQYP